jgi:ferredoxin
MRTCRLDARQCISCGICLDVCLPGALDMRIWRGPAVEGRTREPAAGAMTFPYLSHPERCDGCLICMRECPTDALVIGEAPTRSPRHIMGAQRL